MYTLVTGREGANTEHEEIPVMAGLVEFWLAGMESLWEFEILMMENSEREFEERGSQGNRTTSPHWRKLNEDVYEVIFYSA